MNNSKKSPKDSETIMMALDQISQTIEVMNSVVGRLRHHVQQQTTTHDPQSVNKDDLRSDRVLH